MICDLPEGSRLLILSEPRTQLLALPLRRDPPAG